MIRRKLQLSLPKILGVDRASLTDSILQRLLLPKEAACSAAIDSNIAAEPGVHRPNGILSTAHDTSARWGKNQSTYFTKTQSVCHHSRGIEGVVLRTGFLYRRYGSTSGDSDRHYQNRKCGFVYEIQIKLFLSRTKMISLNISNCLQTGLASGLVSRFNISVPRIISPASKIMGYFKTGNLRAVKAMFRTGEAAPSDSLPDGTSLLHVRTFDAHATRLTP